MGELITILLSKGDKEFDIFCDMLQNSNHLAWADNLKQKAGSLRAGIKRKVRNITYTMLKAVELVTMCIDNSTGTTIIYRNIYIETLSNDSATTMSVLDNCTHR